MTVKKLVIYTGKFKLIIIHSSLSACDLLNKGYHDRTIANKQENVRENFHPGML